jgi:hypothetical protein
MNVIYLLFVVLLMLFSNDLLVFQIEANSSVEEI